MKMLGTASFALILSLGTLGSAQKETMTVDPSSAVLVHGSPS